MKTYSTHRDAKGKYCAYNVHKTKDIIAVLLVSFITILPAYCAKQMQRNIIKPAHAQEIATTSTPAIPQEFCITVRHSRWCALSEETLEKMLNNEIKWIDEQAPSELKTQEVIKITAKTGVINNYDIRSYATDPEHEIKVENILKKIGNMQDAEQINDYIKARYPTSPITGEMIIQASKKHKVPPEIMMAIMQQDSSLGTTGLGARTKNPGNVGNDDSGRIKHYASWADGVDAVAKWLSKHKI